MNAAPFRPSIQLFVKLLKVVIIWIRFAGAAPVPGSSTESVEKDGAQDDPGEQLEDDVGLQDPRSAKESFVVAVVMLFGGFNEIEILSISTPSFSTSSKL